MALLAVGEQWTLEDLASPEMLALDRSLRQHACMPMKKSGGRAGTRFTAGCWLDCPGSARAPPADPLVAGHAG
jgi:hypothetical protein